MEVIDLTTPLATDDSSGPGDTSAVTGTDVPSGAERVFFNILEDGQDEEICQYDLVQIRPARRARPTASDWEWTWSFE